MRNRLVNRSMNGSIDRAVDRSIKPIIYDQPIDRYQRIHWSVSRFIDEPFTRWIEYRWIDRSTNRGIQCYINNQSTNQRPIDQSSERSIHRSIDQSSDRSIYQSIKRSFSNSSNRPDARTEIQRRAVREGTSKISKTENQKIKYTPRGARAPLAPACPYTVNILRRAPAWCIFFGQKVIVTLWPAGSANDRLESFLRIIAIMLLCGFSRRNQTIYPTLAAVVIPLKQIRSPSQALPSDFEQTRSQVRSILLH